MYNPVTNAYTLQFKGTSVSLSNQKFESLEMGEYREVIAEHNLFSLYSSRFRKCTLDVLLDFQRQITACAEI